MEVFTPWVVSKIGFKPVNTLANTFAYDIIYESAEVKSCEN